MEPIAAQAVAEGDRYTYQVKWDGVRMLAFIDGGRVVLQNKGGRIKTATFPELNCLGSIDRQPAVLDGEIVAIHDGKPNFELILKRNFATRPSISAPKIDYIVFDLLQLAGRDRRTLSLAARQELLASIKLPSGPVGIIDSFSAGAKLFEQVGQRGWEGIVAKDLTSQYLPGKSLYWQKVKHRQRGWFWVVGYTANQGQLASVLLGNDFGQGIQLVGAVASGLNQHSRKLVAELLSPLLTKQPATRLPRGGKKAALWVKPLVQAEIEFMEWTGALTLRAPVLRAIRAGDSKIALS